MTQIFVIGGANVDVKCHILGETVLKTSNPGRTDLSVGGVGRNIAHNMALLGMKPKLITALGRDAYGLMIKESCKQLGIDLSGCVEAEQPTGTYTVVLDSEGDLVIGVAAMDAIVALTPAVLSSRLESVQKDDLLVVDANLSPDSLLFVARKARDVGARLVLEPVSVPKSARLLPITAEKLPIYLMSPNLAQVETLTGASKVIQESLPRICALLHARGVQNLVVGLGGDGAFWSNGMRSGFLASKAKQVIDATGAGDSALAATLWALSGGVSLRESASAGQIAAAYTVGCNASVYPDLTSDLLMKDMA